MDENHESYTFRLYVSPPKSEGDGPTLTVYWDTPNKRKALLDPLIQEQAAQRGLEARLLIAAIIDKESDEPHYAWSAFGSEMNLELRVRAILVDISNSRRSDLRRFFGECWTAMAREPNEPFRAVFI